MRWRTLVLVVALGLVGLTQATDTPARVATTVAAEHGGALQP